MLPTFRLLRFLFSMLSLLVFVVPAEANMVQPSSGPPPPWTYRPVQWAGNGPLTISPAIVPLYWGKNATNWVVGGGVQDDDPNLINAYLDGFAAYVSGAYNPGGLEPVTRQYGVIGAARYGGLYTCNGSCSANDTVISDSTIQARIQALQNSNALPPTVQSRIFVVFLKGFNYSLGAGTCAYHEAIPGPVLNPTYYVVVPFEQAASASDGSTYNCSFQTALSHELFETMTDPVPGWAWVTAGSALEVADECEPWNSTYGPGVGSAGVYQFPWGFVQTMASNTTGTCEAWDWMTTSPMTASKWYDNNELIDVFLTTPQVPSGLVHFYSPDGWTWDWEIAGQSVAPVTLAQAPAVTTSKYWANGATHLRMDVVARGTGAGPQGAQNEGVEGYLYHMGKAIGGSWATTQLWDGTVGQVSLVSNNDWQYPQLSVVAKSFDDKITTYTSGDFQSWSASAGYLPTTGVPMAMPSVPVDCPSCNYWDLYTHGDDLATMIDEEASGTVSVLGGDDELPMPPAVATIGYSEQVQRIVFREVNGGFDTSHSVPQTYSPQFTVYDNGWSQWYTFDSAHPYGAMAVITNGNYVDVSWIDRDSFYYYHRRFDLTTHSWNQMTNTANWNPVESLGGWSGYWAPPSMAYGTDGAVYVLGVDINNDNLLATRIDPTGSIYGPYDTGLYSVF